MAKFWGNKTQILAMFALGVLALLGGCIAYAPQEVKETIIISDNGDIDATYEGEFNNLADLMVQIAKQKNDKFDASQYRAQTLGALKAKPYLSRVYPITPDIYHLKWHEKSRLSSNIDSQLLQENSSDDEVPTLIRVNNNYELSENSYLFSSNIAEWTKDAGSDESEAINNYINKFHATIRIELPAKWVLKSNASKTTDIGAGRVALEWSLDLKKAGEAELYISTDPKDKKTFALNDAPKGSKCRDIIGEDCKCGPFKLVNYDDKPIGNHAYELHHPHGIKRGYSDKDGNIDAVDSDITGVCSVTLIPDKNGNDDGVVTINGKANISPPPRK